MSDPSEPPRSHDFRWLVRHRPALPAAIALIAGIVCYSLLPARPTTWIVFAAASVTLATISVRHRFSAIFILAALFFCGLSVAQLRAFFFPPSHIAQFAADEPALAKLELRIAQTPKVFTDPFTRGRRASEHQSFTADVLRVETTQGWQPATGEVSVHLPVPRTDLAAGQTLHVLAYLQRPAPPMNPGQFDWADRLRGDRILATLNIPHPQHVTILSTGSPGLFQSMRDRTRTLLAKGFSKTHSLDHAMLRALLLGDSDPELRDVRAAFQHTGTAHLLAISGLHVVIVAAFIFAICRLLRLHPRLTAFITCTIVVLYGVVALPSAPAIRAIVLCVAVTLCLLHRRMVNPIQLLSLICFAMLLWQPLEIFTPGFQLSFGCVLALMALGGPMIDLFRNKLRDRDLEVAESFRPATGFTAALRWLRSHAEQAAAGGIVAWAISIPIVEAHFGQLNPWAIPFGILLAPLTFAAIVAGLLKIVLTLALPWFAGTWAILAIGPIWLLRHATEFLARIPGGDFPLQAPSGWLTIVYYAAILLAFAPFAQPPLKRATLTVAGLVFAFFVAFPFVAGASAIAPKLKVTLLSVGAGQCAVVEAPDADPVLLDAGSSSISELDYSVISPFLRSEGRDRVGWMFLSHGDYDHISAVDDVVREFDPRIVFASPHLRRHSLESYAAHQMLQDLDAAHLSPQLISEGQRIEVDSGDTMLDVLWPPAVCAMNSNNCGTVLKLTYGGKSILFPGDIQVDAEKELLKHPERLKADVLVAPHHGSSESTTANFVAAVDPEVILASNSHRLTQKQKTFDMIVALRREYRTDRYGAITITIDRAGKIEVTPFLSRE